MIEIDDDEKKEVESIPLSIALKYQFVTPWTSMIVVKKTDDKVIAKSVISDEPRSMEKIKGSYISRSSITTKILAPCSSQTRSIYPTPISSKSHSLGRSPIINRNDKNKNIRKRNRNDKNIYA
eukprot:478657_1